MNEQLICAYCEEPIIDNNSIYKYFPDQKTHKKVHAYHLRITNRKRKDQDETQTEES